MLPKIIFYFLDGIGFLSEKNLLGLEMLIRKYACKIQILPVQSLRVHSHLRLIIHEPLHA